MDDGRRDDARRLFTLLLFLVACLMLNVVDARRNELHPVPPEGMEGNAELERWRHDHRFDGLPHFMVMVFSITATIAGMLYPLFVGGSMKRNTNKNIMNEFMSKITSKSFLDKHKADIIELQKMSKEQIAGMFGLKASDVYKFIRSQLNNNTTRRARSLRTANRRSTTRVR